MSLVTRSGDKVRNVGMSFTKLWESRQKFAPVVLVLGVLAIVSTLQQGSPQDAKIAVTLTAPEKIQSVRIAYTQDGEEIATSTQTFAHGAPPRIYHKASLAPGRYDVRFDIVRDVGGETKWHRLDVPQPGTTMIDLSGS